MTRGIAGAFSLASKQRSACPRNGGEEEGEDQHVLLLNLTLAPGGLLFAIGTRYSSNSEEVVCFDARTLEVRRRFGRGLFNAPGVLGMAAGGNELFVFDQGSVSIKVFSLAGSLLRSFGLGDCVHPVELHHFDGRLYLMDSDENRENARIIVLTLEGEKPPDYKDDGEEH